MFFHLPFNPALHEQVYEPAVFWKAALTSQVWKLIVHSSKCSDASKVSTNETHMHAVKKNFSTRFYKFVLL